MLNLAHNNQATCLLWDGGQYARAQTATITMLLKTPANLSGRAPGDRSLRQLLTLHKMVQCSAHSIQALSQDF